MSSICIAGASGSGKSTSYGNFPTLGIKGLNPEETFIINVSGKDLPFRGWKKLYTGKSTTSKGNYFESADAGQITQIIEGISKSRPDIKNIIVDDAQYIMAFEFMRRAKETGYGKFADIGVNISKVVEAARTSRKDLKVFFMWHPEKMPDGNMKMKTVGTMVDNYLTLEGLFTVILYTKVERDLDDTVKYLFITNNDGHAPAKSPIGMFEEMYMPNDLGVVSDIIDKYNEGE
jgi:hypothetical protein